MSEVLAPLDAGKVAAMRDFVDERFRSLPGWDVSLLRKVAHDAVDKLLAGNHVGANTAIQRLGIEAAVDMRVKLRQLGIHLEPAS